jgi:uncharacterized repeat protein (TIGR01451 family)
MMSRGFPSALSARSRRSFTLFWAALFVMSLGLQYGSAISPTSVLAANPSASLDQCANDPAPSPSSNGCDTNATQWVNGNLGESKSVYFEGDSIPYRLIFDNLSTTGSHAVTIEWDTTKSGKHAIDYIDTYTQSVLDANACLGVTSCGALQPFGLANAIPADPQVTGAGVAPIAGHFSMYGGLITNISAYSYSAGTGFAGDKSASVVITFTATQANPVLAWGGHIASRKDWGKADSAVAISGSPYHTRLIDLDGAGGNQDRSLSAQAVIFPGQITIVKNTTGGNSTFGFTASPLPLPASFSIMTSGGTGSLVTPIATNFTTYTVTEPAKAGWDLTGIVCVIDPLTLNGGTTSTSGRTGTINLNEGEFATCTFSNAIQVKTLSITKSASPTTYDHVGQVITYTIVATNTGNVTQNVTVSDTPALTGFSCSPANGSAVLPLGTMTCTGTYLITLADLNAGSVGDTACADATGATQVCKPATVTAVQSPALSLVKTATPSTYLAVGDVISYSYLVTNTGNVTLAGPVTVTDDKTTAACPALPVGGLAPGDFITCTATYTIIQADLDAGSVTNSAFATSGETKSNTDTATVTAVQGPKLDLVKSATPATYDHVGQVISYSYVLTNTGNVTLSGPFTVTDNKATVTCPDTASLAHGASITCTATYAITQADLDAGSVTNTATGHGFLGETPIASNVAHATVTAVAHPAIHITKTASPASLPVGGGSVTYTYVVTNPGNVALSSVTVTDVISGTSTAACTPTGLVRTGGNQDANLDPGETWTYTCTNTITVSTSNTAVATAHYGEGSVSSTASATVSVASPAPTLGIAKAVTGNTNGTDPILDVPSAKIGDTLTFTLTYTLGNGPVTNAVITDVLPQGYGAPTAISNDGTGAPGTWNATTRSITWKWATLSASGTVSYKVVVLTGADALAQPLTNVASIVSDQTAPASASREVAVAGQVLAATSTPRVTPPPTDTSYVPQGSGTGNNLLLVLLALAAFGLVLGFVTPKPARARQRNRRD